MLAPLIRMNAKALADGTLGVNAKLATLTLDKTVAGVTDTRPVNIVSIRNQADHNIDTREAEDESQFPLIIVCTKADFLGSGMVWTSVEDSQGDIYCVIVAKGGSEALNFLHADYYLRAMKESIHAYLLSSNTRDTNGRRNNIGISNAPKLAFGHASGEVLGGAVQGVLKITYNIRDFTP